MTTTTNAAFPEPAGAVKIWDWELLTTAGRPEPMRAFDGTLRLVEVDGGEDITVQIEGTQHADGRVERAVRIHGVSGDNELIGHARQLARKLMAACDDEAEQMSDPASTIGS